MKREEQKVFTRPRGWGARHTLAVMGFWANAMNYAMRFNLSLAIVAMVKHGSGSHGTNGNATAVIETCAELVKDKGNFSMDIVKDLAQEEGEFNWTEAEQGFILGSFFWGYIITQLPGGMLSQRLGGKWVISIGLLITAIMTFFIPIAAKFGKEALIFVRIIQGLAEGVTFPAFQVLLSKWLPPDERSRLGTVVYSGVSVGTALTMVTSGYLIQFFGWPAVFYGIGTFGIVWFFAWTFLVYDTPELHPRIRDQERQYIHDTIGEQTAKVRMATPWKKIFTSLPVYAIFVAQVSNAWALYTLHTELPTYMRSVLNFEIKENSYVSASPHICMWIFGTVITNLADVMIERKYTSVICMRKVCNSIAQWGTGIALIATAFSGCDRLYALIFLNAAVGMLGAGFGGFVVNLLDIAPNHAGVIMGIGNGICNLCGFAAPYVAGLLISGDPSIENWRIVFFLAAGIVLFGNLFYVIFATGEEMEWNRGPAERYQAQSKPRRFSAISESLQLNVEI